MITPMSCSEIRSSPVLTIEPTVGVEPDELIALRIACRQCLQCGCRAFEACPDGGAGVEVAALDGGRGSAATGARSSPRCRCRSRVGLRPLPDADPADQVGGAAPTVPAPRHDRVPAGRARRVTVVTAVGVTAVAHASILDPCRRRGPLAGLARLSPGCAPGPLRDSQGICSSALGYRRLPWNEWRRR